MIMIILCYDNMCLVECLLLIVLLESKIMNDSVMIVCVWEKENNR